MGLLSTAISWALGILLATYTFQVIHDRSTLTGSKRKTGCMEPRKLPLQGSDPWTRLILRHGQGDEAEPDTGHDQKTF